MVYINVHVVINDALMYINVHVTLANCKVSSKVHAHVWTTQCSFKSYASKKQVRKWNNTQSKTQREHSKEHPTQENRHQRNKR
jgi:hypothetical protein